MLSRAACCLRSIPGLTNMHWRRRKSDLSTLEGQIVDESRTIASQQSAVGAAQAYTQNAAASVNHAASAVNEAQENVESSKAELAAIAGGIRNTRTTTITELSRCSRNSSSPWIRSIRQRTAVGRGKAGSRRARPQVAQAEAQLLSARAAYDQAKATQSQSHSQLAQSQHGVLTLEPLIAQRPGKAADHPRR